MKSFLKQYNIGTLISSEKLTAGTVQENIKIKTSKGNYVLRISKRHYKALLFEVELIRYLNKNEYPSPKIIMNNKQEFISCLNNQHYMIFEYIEGEHLEYLTDDETLQLTQAVAILNVLTVNLELPIDKNRYHYNLELLQRLAEEALDQYPNQKEKYNWLIKELNQLNLPDTMKKSICHCDFNLSNVLFENRQFKALLDFDDACYTYKTWDLCCLINPFIQGYDHNNWQSYENIIDLEPCKKVIQDYHKVYPLTEEDLNHLLDVFKLTLLLDSIWYFDRGTYPNFYEKHKLDALNTLDSKEFEKKLKNVK